MRNGLKSDGAERSRAQAKGGWSAYWLNRFSMLRVRLALVLATSVGFALLLGLALYWGSERVAAYFQRGQTAYLALSRYEALSGAAYRHFKQRLDVFLTGDEAAAEPEVAASRQRLAEAMERLRDSLAGTGGERQSPERIARLTAFLESGMYRFDEAERLRRDGRREEAARLLAQFLADEVDAKFAPLIEAAIGDERAEALGAGRKMAFLVERLHWIALLAMAAATLFGIAAGFFLFRGIRRPMQALMRGTDEIAGGNLAHRIPVESNDEFGYLAGRYNRMAHGLELQRNRLRASQAVLERKVAERTLELNQLNRELQRLDLRRREFFADISHELRTPITVIRGEAEVTLRGPDRDPEEYKEALESIVELATQQAKMVNDLLFLARAEAAQMQFEWEVLDLAGLVVGTAEDLEVLARDKAIAVGLEIPEQPVWVRGDRQRLRQLLFIFGDNACRYSESGGRIDLGLSVQEGEARLGIADQGIGIPAQDLDAVFERHFRGGNTQRPGMEGTGLGLPMAKAIAEAHGGRIAVESMEGRGTTFAVFLPLS